MPSSPLGSTHGRTTSGVACHHRLWTAHTEERRRAWHDIITFGQHTRWNYVGRGMPSSPLGSTKWSNDVGRGMPSSPLGSIHGRTTSGVACHNRLKAAHTVERHRAWHDITTFGQHTRLNDVGRGMPASSLGSTNGRTTSGVACHHRLSNDVGHGMSSSPLGCRNGRTTSGVA